MEYFVKEEFLEQQNLKYFYGAGAVRDGKYFPLDKNESDFHYLRLSDTAINPIGWSDCSLHIGCKRFDKETTLCVALGKSNLNDKTDTAQVFIYISHNKLRLKYGNVDFCSEGGTDFSKLIEITIKNKILTVSNSTLEISGKITDSDVCGYADLFCTDGEFYFSHFDISSSAKPFSEEKHKKIMFLWRKKMLDLNDKKISALEKYVKEHPESIHRQKAFINLPYRLVDKGESMRVELIFPSEENVAFCITHDCTNPQSTPTPIKLDIQKVDANTSKSEIDITFEKAGNTRLELWASGEKITRNVAVYKKGYMALIPWIGSNRPNVDEELHRFDIGGDFWLPRPFVTAAENVSTIAEKLYVFAKNIHKYGDRAVCFINANDMIENCETSNLYDLEPEIQQRIFEQVIRVCKILNIGMPHLFGSYTIDSVGIKLLEKLGIKGLTSLCVWQNWQDGKMKINHWGVSNQPYYPADDDYRRSGEKRDIMCFSMGNASNIRNYSIMGMESCATLCSPGERYMENRVEHFQIQRFYDAFDGYISDAKNSDEMQIFSLSIEAFCGNADWTCINENALRYAYKKSMTENIIFTSAEDVFDYHKRKNLKMRTTYFYQPDYYFGYHNGELPGRVPDRIEADTPEFITVIEKGKTLPTFYFDYTKKWNCPNFEDNLPRNEFGLVNPDTFDLSVYTPKITLFKDVKIKNQLTENIITISVKADKEYLYVPTAFFDVPFESDFTFSCDDENIKITKIYDTFTKNTHLFLTLKNVKAEEKEYKIALSGKKRVPVNAEFKNKNLSTMYFSNHAYARSLDKETALCVSLKAPEGAYAVMQDGEKINSKNKTLTFKLNCDWRNEAPILYGFSFSELKEAVERADISEIGSSKYKKWSW